jgi:hypothetical protein
MRDELLNAAETNAESFEILDRIKETMQAERDEMETMQAEDQIFTEGGRDA